MEFALFVVFGMAMAFAIAWPIRRICDDLAYHSQRLARLEQDILALRGELADLDACCEEDETNHVARLQKLEERLSAVRSAFGD
jgi:hypothetical protein